MAPGRQYVVFVVGVAHFPDPWPPVLLLLFRPLCFLLCLLGPKHSSGLSGMVDNQDLPSSSSLPGPDEPYVVTTDLIQGFRRCANCC